MKSVKVAVYLQDYYSEDSEEQLNKAEKTIIEYINNEPTWEYKGAFKDSDRNFPSYHLERLVREAKKKSIEIILVGSLSKINESLNNAMDTIHEILSMGIRIIFFEEGIDSSTSEGKMLLEKLRSTLAIEKKLASVSRKWTFDRMFEKGNVIFVRLLGYKKIDDQWVIIPEEAEIVREAFKLHLEGLSLLQIARRFISKKYKKANGRMDWTPTAIKNIIKNERYTGDVLCRKTVSDEDVAPGLTIKKKQYLVKDHHEGIISHEDFEKANKLLWQGVKGEDRGDIPKYPLSRKLKCNLCGANFQRSQSRDKVFWRCGTHTKSKSLCPMTGINEEYVKKAMLKAFFDKFNDGVKDFRILIDFLREAETFKDDYVNPLAERINQIIEEENHIVLHGDLNKLEELKSEKVEIEALLRDRTKTLMGIEKDYTVRMKAIGILNELIDKGGSVPDLREALNDFWLLRAFIVQVTIHSDELYDIEWINNEHSGVQIEAGE
ncbi:recombinase family protein [Petrocella sp. FN5]|uniref:recombinase family protein n=1 Tax=Petrocella sp. FN5 TaxID=3032002 RepID=UPI0023DB3F8D|nr:recombinase family protein [Petrocella sp. FN5]MDF1616125.1 recombinase family protein [Petrocella sp. FN5]